MTAENQKMKSQIDQSLKAVKLMFKKQKRCKHKNKKVIKFDDLSTASVFCKDCNKFLRAV